MQETVAILQKEHRNMARLLHILESQIKRMENAEKVDFELLKTIIEYFLEYPNRCHHPKEDIIYCRIRKKAPDALANMPDLEKEHLKIDKLLHEFSAVLSSIMTDSFISREVVGRVGRRFIDNERQHMLMEERIFIPLARRTLSNEDWIEIDARITNKDDPLFGKSISKKFRKIRKEIEGCEDDADAFKGDG